MEARTSVKDSCLVLITCPVRCIPPRDLSTSRTKILNSFNISSARSTQKSLAFNQKHRRRYPADHRIALGVAYTVCRSSMISISTKSWYIAVSILMLNVRSSVHPKHNCLFLNRPTLLKSLPNAENILQSSHRNWPTTVKYLPFQKTVIRISSIPINLVANVHSPSPGLQ